jgi:hypothetical protein
MEEFGGKKSLLYDFNFHEKLSNELWNDHKIHHPVGRKHKKNNGQ